MRASEGQPCANWLQRNESATHAYQCLCGAAKCSRARPITCLVGPITTLLTWNQGDIHWVHHQRKIWPPCRKTWAVATHSRAMSAPPSKVQLTFNPSPANPQHTSKRIVSAVEGPTSKLRLGNLLWQRQIAKQYAMHWPLPA